MMRSHQAPNVGEIVRCNRCKVTTIVDRCDCEGTQCRGLTFTPLADAGFDQATLNLLVVDHAYEFCANCMTREEHAHVMMHDRAVRMGQAFN